MEDTSNVVSQSAEDTSPDEDAASESEEAFSGRNLVVCCDGTGNQFGLANTNVVKLYQVLVKDDQQIVYYDPGVGTFSGPGYKTAFGSRLSKGMGLAFGDGFSQNLREAYRFLAENYREGDRIYCFGFSRGAFTIRALAGLIKVCGLGAPHLENLADYAIGLYREGKVAGDDRSGWAFGNTFGERVKIHCLGLWDTVSSLGFVWSRKNLPWTNINHRVRHVRHALALDERRAYFTHDPWGDLSTRFPKVKQEVVEVWFPGVHSDVGGGYPELDAGIAKIALEWMIAETSHLGLRFDRVAFDRVVRARTKTGKKAKNFQPPDPHGPRHKSLKGIWWLGEVLPKNFAGDGRRNFILPLARRRTVENEETDRETLVHASVVERMSAEGEQVLHGTKRKQKGPYRPKNLPDAYRVVETGTVVFDDGSERDPKSVVEDGAENDAESDAGD